MPDYEIELMIYDEQNPRENPLDPTGQYPLYDHHVVVLVTAKDIVTAENKAVEHIQSVSHPRVAWQRLDWQRRDGMTDAKIDMVTWDNPERRDHQIWLEGAAELPPGDQPESGWPDIYDIRVRKHPFVRPNQRAAKEHAAMGKFFASIPGETGDKIRGLLGQAIRAGEDMKEGFEQIEDERQRKEALHIDPNQPVFDGTGRRKKLN